MGHKSIVECSSPGVDKVIIVISEDETGLSSIHIEDGVSIGVLEIVTLAQLEVDESLHLLLIVNIAENWGLQLVNGLQVRWAGEGRDDLWHAWLMGVLEPEEPGRKVLEVSVFPQVQSPC
jgi:steroid 5-alpha reductase family enzyme